MSNLVVKYWRISQSGKYHACLENRKGIAFGYIDNDKMTPVGDEVQNPPEELKCKLCAGYIKRNGIPTRLEIGPVCENIRVVRIGCNGSFYYDEDIMPALQGIADSQDGETYEVTFMDMKRSDYEALPEFSGF